MTLLDHLAHWAVTWLILATIASGAWCAVAVRHKARRPVARAQYPPPVPPPTTPPFSQSLPAASWFYDVPSDCLSDDAVHSLFDDIVSGFRVIEGTDQ